MIRGAKNTLIKASGDVTENPGFINFCEIKSKSENVVLICGGGSKITEAFKKANYPVKFDDQGRRITNNQAERMLMKEVLEEQKNILKEKLQFEKNISIVIPMLYVGQIWCPINGDDLVKAYYLGFDEIYVFTLRNRLDKKKIIFKDFPNVIIKDV